MSGRAHHDRTTDRETEVSRSHRVRVAPPQSDPSAAVAAGVVFPKLVVGRADDPAERAADRLAEQALGGVAVAHRSPAGVDRLGGLPVDGGTESRIREVRGRGGRPLDDHVRSTLEPGFGVDLSGVRVHTGPEPDRLNRDLQAKAFTSGTDIFFRSDSYEPGTSEGMSLVAHEVAHVVQQGAGGDLQRAFDPKDPDLSTITAIKGIGGGNANMGVYILTGEGGKQLVAKFMQEDPSGAQFADLVAGTAGLGSTGSSAYGRDGVQRVTTAMRQFAASVQDADPALAKDIGAKAARSEKANGVLLMRLASGMEMVGVPSQAADPAAIGQKDYDRYHAKNAAAASKLGIKAVDLITNPEFHKNLGRLYVADSLLGLGDRFSYLSKNLGTKQNLANFMVTADGYINTIDNESAVLGYELLAKSDDADKSAKNWAKWLVEGGKIWDVGLNPGEGFTQDLLKMFTKAGRQKMFSDLIDKVVMLSDKAIPKGVLTFDRFDTGFQAGILDGMTRLVGAVQDLVRAAKQIDAPQAGVDAEGLEVKMEFFKAVLPTLQGGGEIDDAAAARGYAAARAKAEKIVARKEMENRAKLLKTFDATLTPVPQRPAELGTATKAKRKVGRLAEKVTRQNKDKRARSARAKDLRKASGNMSLDQLNSAHDEIGGMADGSHRQQAAAFEVGLQRAVYRTHERARLFENAEADVHAIVKTIPDVRARRDHLAPYGRSEDYQPIVGQYAKVLGDYSRQLGAGQNTEKRDLTEAEKDLAQRVDEFEAELDYVRR